LMKFAKAIVPKGMNFIEGSDADFGM